jgi:hypothetical protein
MNSIRYYKDNDYDHDDSIVIDSSSLSNKKARSILCVICKQRLDNISDNVWKCAKCRNEYFINEILEHEDDFSSSHSDNESIELEGIEGIHKPLVVSADDNYSNDDNNDKKKSGFYSMDYVKGPGKTIIEESEEWPQNQKQ